MKVKNKTTPAIQPGMLNKILFSFSSGKGTYSEVSLCGYSDKLIRRDLYILFPEYFFKSFHLRLTVIVIVMISGCK